MHAPLADAEPFYQGSAKGMPGLPDLHLGVWSQS